MKVIITQKHLKGFKDSANHSENFLSQWRRYFKEKPADEDFILSFYKFVPLYNAIKENKDLTQSTKPLSWFLDNYETITKLGGAK